MRLIRRPAPLVAGLVLLSPAGLGGQGVVTPLRDDLGRSVEVERPPRRVISLVPVVTEIMFALGAGESLVGRSVYADHPPRALDVPAVGEAIRPSVELLVARQPDLVILVEGADNAASVEALERVGVPTYVVVLNTLADLRRSVLGLGRLLDREDAAAALWKGIAADLESVATAVRDRPRKSVYYDVAFPPPITVGRGSYLDTLIAIAGGSNAFHDLSPPSPQVNLEAIATRHPDLIVYPRTRTSPPALPPRLRPGWNAIPAVRDGRVRVVDGDLLHRLGPRIGKAARALAQALHPEAFRKDDPERDR